jgi:cobalt-zinc-cadmium efflux system protein
MSEHHQDHHHDRLHGHGHHHHGHGHHHGHAQHGGASLNRAFAIGTGLNLLFVVVEAVYGILADSMALLADAGHNLSDVLALVLAWGAMALARRGPTARFTYGLRSSSILAALVNAVLLLVVTGGIAWEAVTRLFSPVAVVADVVIWVAFAGIVVNASSAMLFAGQRKNDINVRGAFVHLAADAAISLAVVVAGVLMKFTGWAWLDPALGIALSIVIVVSTWGLLRDSVSLALNAVPAHIDPQRVREYLGSWEGVAEVHDLHIWAMSTTETALTVHLVMPRGYPGDACVALMVEELRQRFHVHHPTIQIETGDTAHTCPLAPGHLV